MRRHAFLVHTRKAVTLAAAGILAMLAGCAHRNDPTPLSVLPVATACDAYNLQLLAYDVEPAVVEARRPGGNSHSIKPFRATRDLVGPDTRTFLLRTFPYTTGGALIAGAMVAPIMVGADIIALPFDIFVAAFGDPIGAVRRQRRIDARAAYDALLAAHAAGQCAAPEAYLARPDVTAALMRFDAQVQAAAETSYRIMVERKYWRQPRTVQIYASDAASALRRAGTPNPFGGRWRKEHAVFVAEAADLRERFRRDGHVVSSWERLQIIRAAIAALPDRDRCNGASWVASALNKHHRDVFTSARWSEELANTFATDYRKAAKAQGGDGRWPRRRLLGSFDFCSS